MNSLDHQRFPGFPASGWNRILLAAACCLTLVSPLHAQAQPGDMVFREIGVQKGLEGRAITDVLVDNEGFIWATSREGLYRYDGYRAELFLPDASNPNAISDSDLRALFQSSDGSIWVSANTGGLNRLDPGTREFEVFRHDPENPHSLSYDSVYAVVEDHAGDVWVATQFGLNRLDRASGRFTRFRHDAANADSLAHDYVYDLTVARDGSVWAATVGGGLSHFVQEPGQLSRFDLAGSTGDVRHNDVFAVLESQDGTIWAGTRSGLLRIDRATGEIQAAAVAEPGAELVITSLAEGPAGRLWMGTVAGGVLIFDPHSLSLVAANSAPLGSDGQLPALPQLVVTFLDDRLLVGTWGGGLFLGSRPEAAFRLIPVTEGGLNYHDVTAVFQDDAAGHLWVGTFGGGLQGYDPRQQVFLAPPDVEPPFQTSGILSIARTSDGTLFAGDTTGLWQLALPEQRTYHQATAGQSGSIGSGYVTTLLPHGNSLLVGTGGSGLFRLDGQSGFFEPLGSRDGSADTVPGDFITILLDAGPNALWVGTRSNGLSLCTVKPWSCPQHLETTSDGLRLSHDNVTTLYRDTRNRIWIGTDGGGLHLAQLDEHGFISDLRQWSERDGLISASVLGMVEDDDGSLWISTRRGLSRLSAAGDRFVNYTGRNGLETVSFNARAVTRDTDRLYFGAVGGLVEVAAGQPFSEQPASPVGITHVRKLGNNDVSAADPRFGRTRFHYGEPVSVQFAVLDYAETPHEYEYRPAGAAEWIPLDSRRDLALFGLSPGSQVFEIRGRDRLGLWSEAAQVEFEVVPPYWMTHWFRAMVLMMLGVLLFGIHLFRTQRLRQRYLELRGLQAQREEALRETELRGEQLNEAYQGLVHLTRRLESVKEDERQHLAHELHDELGQNLTAAKIDLQVFRQQLPEPALQSHLDQSLVNLDNMIAQVRSLSLSLRPPLLEEAGLVAALEHLLSGLSERSGVEIELAAAPEIPSEPGQVAKVIFRVVQEAVNNALRHAKARHITVTLSPRENGLGVVVSDDGIGFDPEAARRSASTGEHLGLLGMAERVRAAGGTLGIDAAPGRGCRVTAWVPW